MSETRPLVERLRASECDSQLKTCRENWPDHPASWCSGCLELAAADQIEADAARIETLRGVAGDALNRAGEHACIEALVADREEATVYLKVEAALRELEGLGDDH